MSATSELWSRATSLHQQGRPADALPHYDALLREQPSHTAALHYSGVAAYQTGDLAKALDRLREAVRIEARNADAWSNLGLVLQAIGQLPAAVEAFEKAARVDPESPEIITNLASGLFASGRYAEAAVIARRLVARDPTHAKAWYILSLALQPEGRMLEALDAATRAAGLAPDQAGYAGLKAQIENGIGAPDKARRTLEDALARQPMSAPLRFELANLLEYKLDDPVGAAAAYAQVLRIEPGHGAALSQLTFLCGGLADWRDHDDLVERYRAGVAAGARNLSPFGFLSLPSTRAEQRRCAQTWAADLASIEPLPRRRVLSPGRLRIGYLSGDFHSHATAFLAAGLFESHDRANFEVFGYSHGPDDGSQMRARVIRAFDRFADLRDRDPLAIADAIRSDTIDILVDLKGHTQGALPVVLARRPAPIIAHYLGYPGTLAAGLADYLIGDPVVTPPEHFDDYDEAIAVLPDSYQINDRARPIGETPPRGALGLPPDGVVFASFNQTYKINPEVFDAWMAILREVPGAALWLLARRIDHPAIGNLRGEARSRGVDPARLVFAAHRPNPDYLALYRHADLFLDTWPYNAHTTASDALWAGCPVLTVLGTTFAGRVGASLLHAVGLAELVTPSVDDYVRKAIALAGDAETRLRLRTHLAGPGRSSALFDTVRTTRALEAAYRGMAAQFREGVRRSFRIQATPLPAQRDGGQPREGVRDDDVSR